jgi:hypothetical protein
MKEAKNEIFMQKASQLSPCRSYRYTLDRIWDTTKSSVLFILFNPSTADETHDDPTLRRCIHFAQSWGYGALRIVNLYSLRTSNPKTLHAHPLPKGPDHDLYFQQSLLSHQDILCAWGLKGGSISCHFKPGSHRIFHLGINKDGSPKHPLYLPARSQKIPWKE